MKIILFNFKSKFVKTTVKDTVVKEAWINCCCTINIDRKLAKGHVRFQQQTKIAIYRQQITILGLISSFRANIYLFETDFSS
jgi:hypothetical protein